MEGHIWRVHISAFKEGVALTAYENYVTWEVRINDYIPLLRKRAYVDSTDLTSGILMGNLGAETTGELKDVSNFW